MFNDFHADSYVPPHPEVPPETHRAVLLDDLAHRQALVKISGKYATQVAHARQEHKQQLESKIGNEKYGQLRDYLAEAQAEQAEKLLPPPGLKLSRQEIEEISRQRKEAAHAYLLKLGIDAKEIGAANRRFQARVQKLALHKPATKRQPGTLVATADVPKKIRTYKTNPWTLVRPPYPGWNRHLRVIQSGDNLQYVSHAPWETSYLDREAGQVGSRVNIYHLSHPGDNDTASVERYDAVGFWFQMPVAGLIEAWIELQAVNSSHSIHLHDEWGWSRDSLVDQSHFVAFRTLSHAAAGHPTSEPESEALVSRLVAATTNDIDWDNSFWPRGSFSWTHHFSETVFAGGTWVWVQVGVLSAMSAFADDVRVDATMDFKWFVRSVQIRSTGAD